MSQKAFDELAGRGKMSPREGITGERYDELLAIERRYQALVKYGWRVTGCNAGTIYGVWSVTEGEMGRGATPEAAIDAAIERLGK